MRDNYKVLIVDDDAGFLNSLRDVLTASGMQVFTSLDSLGALKIARKERLDCAVVDYNLGAVLGTEVIEELRVSGCMFPIIVVTAFGDVGSAVKSMKVGAAEFIEKPFDPPTLIAAIRNVVSINSKAGRMNELVQRSRQVISALTIRERQIVDGIVAGKSSRVLADELGVSPRTVEAHRANILGKLSLTNTAALVRLAVLAGLHHGEAPPQP